jgi:hypothetical protein
MEELSQVKLVHLPQVAQKGGKQGRTKTFDTSTNKGAVSKNIMWCIDPLLRGDSVKKRTVSGQRLGKHVPAVTNTQATTELLL